MNTPSIARIVTLRDKLHRYMVINYSGKTKTSNEFLEFVQDIANQLPKDIKIMTIFESLRWLLGMELTSDKLFQAAWLLAGNLELLKKGQSIPPWQYQTFEEWVPVQITNTEIHRRHSSKELGYLITFKIMGGTSCSYDVVKYWSFKYCRFVSRQLGFTYSDKKYPFANGHELVSMRMFVLITPKESDNKPGFEKIKHPSGCLNWNKMVLKARIKIDPPCPMGFNHACWRCPVGYVDCLAGTHRLTFTKRFCVECKQNSYFDPDKDYHMCVACTTEAVMGKQKD